MFKPVTNKGLFWELRNSIWTLWTFFPFGFFNYISFFYIAMRFKDKKLFGYGVLYALPFINYIVMDSYKSRPLWYENLSFILIFVVWIISIFHVIKVRKHYLLSRANSVTYVDQLAEENRQLQQKLQSLTKTNNEVETTTEITEPPFKAVESKTKSVENKIESLIDINIASEKELASIVEIGPLLASKIIVERQKIGRFTSYEHFTEVMNFKPHIAHKLKKYLTVILIDTPQKPTPSKQGRVIDY